VIVGIVAYVATNSDALAKEGLESYGSAALGTKLTVDDVHLSLTEGEGTVKGLAIAQPSGFEGDDLLQVDSVAMRLDVPASTTDVVVIDSITVDGARLHAIVRGGRDMNFQALLNNVKRGIGDAGDASADADATKLIIRRFDFVNARATTQLPLVSENIELPLDDIHLTDIGKATGGATPEEVARVIVGPITSSVMRAVARSASGSAIDDMRDKLKRKLGGSLDKLRELGHPVD
jgi:hypothetical protein